MYVKFSRKIAAIALSCAAAVSSVVAAPAATAAPAGNIVTLGDSFTANPDVVANTLNMVNLPKVVPYPETGGCLQAPNNWPAKLRAKTGASVADWSCSGDTSEVMLKRLNSAIAHGDVHKGTRTVVIAVGMNDYGPFALLQGYQPINPLKMRADYVNNIKIAAKKIRKKAPKAKIVLAGRISGAAVDAPHMFCPVNVIPNKPMGIPLPLMAAVERANENNQRAAAKAIGATFVAMREPSRGHSTCAKDSERYVAGAIDTTTPNYNWGLHPSDKGSEFIANRLSRVV